MIRLLDPIRRQSIHLFVVRWTVAFIGRPSDFEDGPWLAHQKLIGHDRRARPTWGAARLRKAVRNKIRTPENADNAPILSNRRPRRAGDDGDAGREPPRPGQAAISGADRARVPPAERLDRLA